MSHILRMTIAVARCVQRRVHPVTLAGCLAVSLVSAGEPAAPLNAYATGAVHVLPFDITLPGTLYRQGDVWQALVCNQDCVLETVHLKVTPTSLIPYDGDRMVAQNLSIVERPKGRVIVLFQGLPAAALKQPIVTLLHSGMSHYPRPEAGGTLEINIPPLRGEGARIVPRYAPQKQGDAANSAGGGVRFYLDTQGRRQRLAQVDVDEMVGFNGIAQGNKLLLWAGDLDGDGKLDLLMSFNARAGEASTLTLLLSSAAKDNDLVGEAGRFYYWPVGNPGC